MEGIFFIVLLGVRERWASFFPCVRERERGPGPSYLMRDTETVGEDYHHATVPCIWSPRSLDPSLRAVSASGMWEIDGFLQWGERGRGKKGSCRHHAEVGFGGAGRLPCTVYGIAAIVGMEAGRGGGIGDRRGKNGSSVSHGDEIRP